MCLYVISWYLHVYHVFFFIILLTDGAMYGIATFNMRGVEGTITFIMENGSMMISVGQL